MRTERMEEGGMKIEESPNPEFSLGTSIFTLQSSFLVLRLPNHPVHLREPRSPGHLTSSSASVRIQLIMETAVVRGRAK